MDNFTSINSINDDIKTLLNDLIDQIHLMNSLCENVSIKIEPRHHNLSHKSTNRSTASKHRKRRIFSSSEDDSSSLSDESFFSEDHKTIINEDSDDEDEQKALHNRHGPRTRNELVIDDLPPIENLTITLSEETPIEPIGHVRHIVDEKLVIIESLLHSPPLNDDSVLFNRDRRSIGLIFETFGPVEKPYYSIRYNDINSINQRRIELNQEVFYAPKETTYTKYVFVQELKALKGSDASWEDDNEPPKFAIEYSDDEQERAAKAVLRGKRTLDEGSSEQMFNTSNNDIHNATSNFSNNERGRGRGRHRGFRRGGNSATTTVFNSNRLPPTIPNWFQNTSSSPSFQYLASTTSQQQSPWQSTQNYSSSGSSPHFANNDANRQQQQPFQNNTSAHSAFPWM